MLSKFYFLLGVLLIPTIIFSATLPIVANGIAVPTKPAYKLGSNAINVVSFGDINLIYEIPVFNDSSLVIGGHINPDKYQYDTTGKYGAFLGYKLYLGEQNEGLYLSSLLGFNREKSADDFADVLSLEFWIGHTFKLQKNAYIDLGIGMGRKYKQDEKSDPALLGGINIGFCLPDKVFGMF